MSLISLSDSSAPIIALGITTQLAVLVFVFSATLAHLRKQRSNVNRLAAEVQRVQHISEIPSPGEKSLAIAWERMLGSLKNPAKEAIDPQEAFNADGLLPRKYNARLDAAAPGLFTALGIVGTFVGLIMAFGHVDPTQSEQSIAPLVNGMSSAFWNSLAGVLLSIAFTYFSRATRHRFELACKELADAIEEKIDRVRSGDQVLRALSQINVTLGWIFSETKLARQEAVETRHELSSGLSGVATATQDSSAELLSKLAPQLEQVFKTLVDAPFENLGRTVTQFQESVEQVAERHGYVVDALDAAALGLGAAQNALAIAAADAAGVALQFEAAAERIGDESERASAQMTKRMTEAASVLEAQTNRSAETVARAIEVAGVLGAGVELIRTASERQNEAAAAMNGVTVGLGNASTELHQISSTFGDAAGRLEQAVGQIRKIAAEAAEDSTRIAREELQRAVSQMADALKEFGEQNVRAYQISSENVIAAIDTQMTDLTERLSAELNTLMVRLPDVANSMTTAAKSVRVELDRAIKGLGISVHQLDVASRQSLKAQLEEYDGAVAKAVNHFSGTLSIWDGKVSELTGVVRQLETTAARKDVWVDNHAKVEGMPVVDTTLS